MKWLAALAAPLLTVASAASEWPQFRGPQGTGIAEGNALPTRFGEDVNLIWKSAVPTGHSSPVIAGDRIYLTAFENEKLLVLALERSSGELIWMREVPRPRREPFQRTHGPASPSPVTDGSNVYAFFATSARSRSTPTARSSGDARWDRSSTRTGTDRHRS